MMEVKRNHKIKNNKMNINKNNEEYIKIKRVWIQIFIGIMIFSLLIGLLLVRWTNKHYSGGTPLG